MTPFQLPEDISPRLSVETVIEQSGPTARPFIEAVNSLMAINEYPVHMLIQDRIKSFRWHPSALVLTNRRILIVDRKIFSQTFLDMSWAQAHDAHLVETWRGATFAIQSIKGNVLEVDALPVNLARSAYAFAQRAEELAGEWRRFRSMEEERARARGVSISDLTGTTHSHQSPTSSSPPSDDIEQGLRRLEDLKNKGLISEQEYSDKRSEFLSRL